jgi:hypothetical protein
MSRVRVTGLGYVVIVLAGLAACFGLGLLQAQFVVWGLSLFHVHSGIWGPWFLLGALDSSLTFAAVMGKSSSR